MKAKCIIAILAIVGLLAFVAVSVLGGSKDKVVSTRAALRAPENRAQSSVGDRCLLGSLPGTKDVPQQINYQGYLVDSSDSSAISNTLEMTFIIYDNPSNGNLLWSEPQSVPVINGLFNVLLGSVEPLPDSIFTGQELWLETKIGDQTLSPRKKLVSVPYAIKNDCWTSSGDNCYFDKSGNVGIGTMSPNQQLDIESGNPQIRIHDTASNEATIGAGYLVHDGSGIFHIKSTRTTSPGRIALDSGGSERMSIMYNGNVGIGTDSPGAKLEVADVNPVLRLQSTSAPAYYSEIASPNNTGEAFYIRQHGYNILSASLNADNPGITIGHSGTDNTIIYGNVGIGTTNPQGKLDVNGPLAIAGDVGAAGQVLKSQGPGANPTWGNVDFATNSDMVDNIHASTTPTANYLYPLDANAKFPNSRLYTGSGNGLDVDKLDGYHAGNSSGNVPVSNGALNSNLNADMLDGQHASAFLTTSNDYGRYGVASSLYEDTQPVLSWNDDVDRSGIGLTLSSSNSHAITGFTNANTSGYAAIRGENRRTHSVGAIGLYNIGVYGDAASGTYAGKFDGRVQIDYTGGGNVCAILANSNGNWGAVQGVNSSTGPGVYASNTAGNPALVTAGDAKIQGTLTVTGNCNISGHLTKGSGSFKIDHPLDPENKYLYHSFVESPDMMNVYNGNALLDANGEAVVELPDYFEGLNKDFRYQLTAIGAPGPNLYIAEKITNNHFKIVGGQPGMEVSWQVTGVRKDPYAEANRIQVEIDKPVEERGKYLHPEAYGLGPEYGIGNGQDRRVER